MSKPVNHPYPVKKAVSPPRDKAPPTEYKYSYFPDGNDPLMSPLDLEGTDIGHKSLLDMLAEAEMEEDRRQRMNYRFDHLYNVDGVPYEGHDGIHPDRKTPAAPGVRYDRSPALNGFKHNVLLAAGILSPTSGISDIGEIAKEL